MLFSFLIGLPQSLATTPVSVSVNPNGYSGKWTIDVHSGDGSKVVDLIPGSYQVKFALTGFDINVAVDGTISVENTVSAIGGQGTLTFNTTTLNVNPNGYEGRLSIGAGPVLGSPSNPTETLSTLVVPGLSYTFEVAYHANFRISIDGNGNVTTDNDAAASTSGNTLTLNTTTLNVEPNGYEGRLSMGLGPVFGWSSASAETLSKLVVPGLSYTFEVALYSNFRINIDSTGNVTTDNDAAAWTSGNIINLNTISLNVQANDYDGSWKIVNGPGPKYGSDSVLIVPLSSYLFIASDVQKSIHILQDCIVEPFIITVAEHSLSLTLSCGSPPDNAPIVNAGLDLTFSSENQNTTVIEGTASDPELDFLTYRWLEGDNELLSWRDVGPNGEAYFDLSLVPHLSLGGHVLTLQVSDGLTTSSDDMILTVENSAPHPAPTGEGTYKIVAPVSLGGQVSDFDGDHLSYEWLEGDDVLCMGELQAGHAGEPTDLPVHTTSDLTVGNHILVLRVNDGVNDPVSQEITVEIIDITAPTLAPDPNQSILWPPNRQMVDVVIDANASDNSGEPITLSATVSSNEPQDGPDDGDTGPDWTEPIVDQQAGTITLELRAERFGSGEGREYTVAITAVDGSGNSSTANVNIIVPHDQRRK
jgi:hypothetical protein